MILKFLPLMIGWFSLNLPSGLGLYYFANTVLTTGQQIWLRKLGGERKNRRMANVPHVPALPSARKQLAVHPCCTNVQRTACRRQFQGVRSGANRCRAGPPHWDSGSTAAAA